MSKVYIFNNSRVQRDVKGSDDQTYFMPPKRVSSLPNNVTVQGSMSKDLKITKPPITG